MGTSSTVEQKAPPTRRSGSLTKEAADLIRQLVVTGELRPGDRVNELELSSRLGMSRGPVREAIRRLASSGLLVEEPNIGARVISPNTTYIRELYSVREELEAMAAREAARRMTDEERTALHAILDDHQRMLDSSEGTHYSHSPEDWDFHQAILKGARNSIVSRICGNDLRDVFLLLRTRYNRRSSRGREALKEHRWIADAIAAGNPEVAGILMRQHIQASRDVFLEIMGEIDDGSGK